MRSLLLFFALVCTQANTSAAQQPDSVRSLFDRAHRGNWYLRARLADSTTIEGRVPRLQVDAATLGRESVQFDQVAALERRVRVGSSAKPVGMLMGGALGGLLVLAYSGLCENQCGGAGMVGSAAVGFAAGFALGAFMGGSIDPGKIEWRAVYHR